MSYSCSDFTDSILEALAIDVPEESLDSPSDQADLALAEIERLQKIAAAVLDTSKPMSRKDHAVAGLTALTLARDHFKAAGASARLLDKIRLAISSAKGAVRHAGHKSMGLV